MNSSGQILEEDKLGEFLARALKLSELIDYQPGSIVSREITSKKAGTLTLFAFDKGQGLSEHTAPFDATVLCLEGEAEVMIQTKPIRVRKDEMVIIPADLPHSLEAKTKFKMLLIMIRS
jgi:quercetin dioxygenase-like cupin family protein